MPFGCHLLFSDGLPQRQILKQTCGHKQFIWEGISRKQSEGVEKGEREETKANKRCVHKWATVGSALLWCLWEPAWNTSLSCPTERQRNLGISFFFLSVTNWGPLLRLLALWHFQPAPRGQRISQTERSRKPSAYIGTTSSELLEQAKRLRLEHQTAPPHIPFTAFPNPTSAFQIGLEEPSHWSHSTNVLATLHNFVVSLGGPSPLHCGHFKSKVFTRLHSPHLARCLGLIKPDNGYGHFKVLYIHYHVLYLKISLPGR